MARITITPIFQRKRGQQSKVTQSWWLSHHPFKSPASRTHRPNNQTLLGQKSRDVCSSPNSVTTSCTTSGKLPSSLDFHFLIANAPPDLTALPSRYNRCHDRRVTTIHFFPNICQASRRTGVCTNLTYLSE